MAPATFLTSLGLIDAALVRTNAIVSVVAGAAISSTSRTEGSPKVLNRIARMTCFLLTWPPARIRLFASVHGMIGFKANGG
jgi:hypothetical protein